MKNICKEIVAIVTMITLVLSSNIAVYAAQHEVDEDVCQEITKVSDNTISPRGNQYESGGVYVTSTAWRNIATSTNGFSCNVKIGAYTGNVAYLSVRMLGRNGNVVWSETNAVAGNHSRVFWCGSDIYTIQAKATSGNATVTCWPN